MNHKLLSTCVALVLGAGVGYALDAYAQVKPETQVKQRQAAMTLQGKYIGPLVGMAKGKIPYNAAVAARNAGFLEALSQMPWDGFHPNTKDEKTRALPAIYENEAKFKESQDRFQAAVTKLVSATKGGDEAAVKTQVGEVLKACNSCHDDFRGK